MHESIALPVCSDWRVGLAVRWACEKYGRVSLSLFSIEGVYFVNCSGWNSKKYLEYSFTANFRHNNHSRVSQ
jgi:hypothetical protein